MVAALISLGVLVNVLHNVDLSPIQHLHGRKLASSCTDREPRVCDTLGVADNCKEWTDQGFASFPELICQESCNTCPHLPPPSPPSTECVNAWWCPDSLSDVHCDITALASRCPVTCNICSTTPVPECLPLAPSDNNEYSFECETMSQYTLVHDRCTAYDVFLIESKALGDSEYTCS